MFYSIKCIEAQFNWCYIYSVTVSILVDVVGVIVVDVVIAVLLFTLCVFVSFSPPFPSLSVSVSVCVCVRNDLILLIFVSFTFIWLCDSFVLPRSVRFGGQYVYLFYRLTEFNQFNQNQPTLLTATYQVTYFPRFDSFSVLYAPSQYNAQKRAKQKNLRWFVIFSASKTTLHPKLACKPVPVHTCVRARASSAFVFSHCMIHCHELGYFFLISIKIYSIFTNCLDCVCCWFIIISIHFCALFRSVCDLFP